MDQKAKYISNEKFKAPCVTFVQDHLSRKRRCLLLLVTRFAKGMMWKKAAKTGEELSHPLGAFGL